MPRDYAVAPPNDVRRKDRAMEEGGKKKEAPEDFPGAFVYGERPPAAGRS